MIDNGSTITVGVNDAHWRRWIDAFPAYTLQQNKDFSAWRRAIEVAAQQPIPSTPLSAIDKTLVLAALTHHADRLKTEATATSNVTVMLTSATLAAGIGALLFHPLTIAATVLGLLALAKRTWENGLGSNAGNRAVHDLLTNIAGELP